jgi:predicted PurR-regulated permease PerM
MSAATGLVVGGWLFLTGGELPVLFGLLAFLLNYIPNLGSILAAVPAIVLTALQHGASKAAVVAAGYLVVNVVVGNVIEPRVMGRALGLSPLVVLVSVVVWGWLLGPVGALLSALLTVMVKLLLLATSDLRALGLVLGPAPDLASEEAPQASEEGLAEDVVPHARGTDG